MLLRIQLLRFLLIRKKALYFLIHILANLVLILHVRILTDNPNITVPEFLDRRRERFMQLLLRKTCLAVDQLARALRRRHDNRIAAADDRGILIAVLVDQIHQFRIRRM